MNTGFYIAAAAPHLHLQLSGRLTAEDHRGFVPAIERALAKYEKLRMLVELTPAFDGWTAGAVWQDLMVRFSSPFTKAPLKIIRLPAGRRPEYLDRFLIPGSARIQSVQTIADAIAAVLQHASAPASIARGASDEKSARRVGAMAPSPPI
jgi:hypothetical protein